MSDPCRRLATLLVLAGSLGVLAGPVAADAVDPVYTGIDGKAKLMDAGRRVRVTGQVRCPACKRLTLAVTISQRTGGLAQGGVRCVCGAATERWSVNAKTRQSTRLRSGRARVCTWVIGEGPKGTAIDAYQWCRDVTLA